MSEKIVEPISDLTEHQLSSKLVYQGGFLEVWHDQVKLPDAKLGQREYIKHPGAVVIVPINEQGELYLVRQFRYPIGQVFVEFPAGKLEVGEDLLNCAHRELSEETGLKASKMQYVGEMYPCIGYSNEKIEIFLATQLKQELAHPDQGEFVEPFKLTLEQLEQAIFAGEVGDAKTVTALYRCLPYIQKEIRD